MVQCCLPVLLLVSRGRGHSSSVKMLFLSVQRWHIKILSGKEIILFSSVFFLVFGFYVLHGFFIFIFFPLWRGRDVM